MRAAVRIGDAVAAVDFLEAQDGGSGRARAEAVGERKLNDYIARHWRGEQHVIWSLLVNGVAAYVAMIVGAALLVVFAGGLERALVWATPFFLVWFIWAVVGTVRAAIATPRDRNSSWLSKLVALFAFAGLVLILLGFYNDLPIVRRWLLG
jgi:hypothetical protein